MSIHDVFKTDSDRLSKLTDLDEGTKDLYKLRELSVIWRHQLDALLEIDLTSRIEKPSTTYAAASATAKKHPQTFRTLLGHPSPPIELLKLAKDFAKTHIQGSEGVLPQEIALALYYGCIAAALARCHQRITRLNDEKLRRGLKWSIAQSWLDESTLTSLQKGLDSI